MIFRLTIRFAGFAAILGLRDDVVSNGQLTSNQSSYDSATNCRSGGLKSLVRLYQQMDNGSKRKRCEGVLLNKRWILTAASCAKLISDATKVTMKFGDFRVNGKEWTTHPDNTDDNDYDVALLKVKEDIIDTNHECVQYVKFPPKKGFPNDNLFDCRITGEINQNIDDVDIVFTDDCTTDVLTPGTERCATPATNAQPVLSSFLTSGNIGAPMLCKSNGNGKLGIALHGILSTTTQPLVLTRTSLRMTEEPDSVYCWIQYTAFNNNCN